MKFDPKKDYFKELTDDELWDGEFPLLKGLQRLAHERGLVKIDSKVITTPTNDTPLAAVTVTVEFSDGTSFSASADAKFKVHKEPFHHHLTAIADSKAEARAYRRAFNISKASKEECGEMPAEGDVDTTPIAESQIEGIKNIAGLHGLSVSDAIGLIGATGAIESMTRKQGRDIMKALNKYRPKKNGAKKRTAKTAE